MKKIEFFLKNIFLNLLIFFNPVKKEKALPEFSSNSTLLFIRLNRIGDALVTTPLLHEAKTKIGCRVIVLADKKNHFIFRNNPSIDEVIIFDKGIRGVLGINTIINEKNIDAVIDLHDDVSTTVSFLVALAKVKHKFGLLRSNSAIFTHTVQRLNPSENHIILRLLKLSDLLKFEVNPAEVSVRYYPSEEVKNQALEWISKINPDKKFLVGINLSAGSKARFWGVEKFRMLLNSLNNYEINIILFCTDEDLPLARQIGTDEQIYPFTKGFDIFTAAIMQLDLLITPDTSVVQIASINKIPLFGIYVKYKTNDMLWTPLNTDFDCVLTEDSTVENISFEEVNRKLIPFLEKQLNVKNNT
ncbi:MAG TPA: glycosyltransferase family 9 protein [Ignavibacteriaceae bacterium]|nr:glycosyltransferase family 9 protein [Ignavibacteriaceae bacterium]